MFIICKNNFSRISVFIEKLSLTHGEQDKHIRIDIHIKSINNKPDCYTVSKLETWKTWPLKINSWNLTRLKNNYLQKVEEIMRRYYIFCFNFFFNMCTEIIALEKLLSHFEAAASLNTLPQRWLVLVGGTQDVKPT